MQSLGAITMGTRTIVHTIPVATTLPSLGATPGLVKLTSSLPGLAQISNQASGLKVPTTITLTLRGQLSRITMLSPMGSEAAPSEEPPSQVLPSSSQHLPQAP
ncbi:KAT8 regulatory NSL complex subunit 3 [Plecturocebus cupreus]